MRKLALSIIICLVFVGHLCIGQDEETFDLDSTNGQWVLAGAKAFARFEAGAELNEKDKLLSLSVIAYMEGYIAGLIFAPVLDPHHLCPNSGVTSEQILKILEEYLEELLEEQPERPLPPVRSCLLGSLLQDEYSEGIFCLK